MVRTSTDNDLKEALASMRKLEEDYVAVANRLAEAISAICAAKFRSLRRMRKTSA